MRALLPFGIGWIVRAAARRSVFWDLFFIYEACRDAPGTGAMQEGLAPLLDFAPAMPDVCPRIAFALARRHSPRRYPSIEEAFRGVGTSVWSLSFGSTREFLS